MSTTYQAVIIVGLPVYETGCSLEWLECQGMDLVSPYYDCPGSEQIIGFIYASTNGGDYIQTLFKDSLVEELSAKFEKIFKLKPNLYLTTDNY